MTDIVMYCTHCGAKYNPNPAGRAPITCACNAPFSSLVTFEDGDAGRVRIDWEIALDPEQTEREATGE